MPSQDANKKSARPIAGPLKTQRQSEEAAAASIELSIPSHVRQHDSAPKAVGYVLTEQLGSGAYGQVWRAWQLRTRKVVAVKVFTQRTGLDWIFLQREVERLARLDRHPHIVTMLDTGLEEEPPFYVMDVIEGGALDQFVDPGPPVDPARAMRWMSQICDALSYVHGKGLIHCDLKPANLLVDGRDHIRVVDFGQSRVFTESAASIGTLFFMAPEQAQLAEPGSLVQPDVHWDIYALGVSLYAILTGRVPYTSRGNVESLESAPTLADRLKRYRGMLANDPPPEWNGASAGSADAELIAVVNKCMARNPDDRYASVPEIEQDLQAMRERRPITPLAASASYRSKKFLQRNPFKVVLCVAVVALAVSMAFGAVRQARLDRAEAAELMAGFVDDPANAVSEVREANTRITRHLGELAEKYVASFAFTDRIMGARAALCLDRSAFWNSIESGPLWDHGEWLELIDAFGSAGAGGANAEDLQGFLDDLDAKLSSGSPREKYVALCLIGQIAPEPWVFADRCASLAATESEPGIVLAAAWAARRLGSEVHLVSSDRVFVDEHTQMVFVAIPSETGFRRGSGADDLDRFADEDRPEHGVDIASMYMATTEVTQEKFALFLTDVMMRAAETEDEQKELDVIMDQFKATAGNDKMRVALGGITLKTARRFYEWLNATALGASPARTYRLPTEDEWEYAARAGNETGRFCFGDSASYARYFAHCDGSPAAWHTVAQRMPNFYGLSDMHGGLWEHTESRYPPEHAVPADREKTLYVLRGGAYYSPAVRCRSAQRNYETAAGDDTRATIGIRLVMELEE